MGAGKRSMLIPSVIKADETCGVTSVIPSF